MDGISLTVLVEKFLCFLLKNAVLASILLLLLVSNRTLQTTAEQ